MTNITMMLIVMRMMIVLIIVEITITKCRVIDRFPPAKQIFNISRRLANNMWNMQHFVPDMI